MKAYTNIGTQPLVLEGHKKQIEPGEDFSYSFTAADEARLTRASNIKERQTSAYPTPARAESVKAHSSTESAKASERTSLDKG